MAKLYRVILPVTNIEAAASFYAAVLMQPGRRVSPGRHYFDCEGTLLACYDPGADGDQRDAHANPEHIYLAVDDLEDCYQRCHAASAEPDPGMGGIKLRPWGERSFYVFDPFGNPVCFVDRKTVFTG
jgi:catechol 2,3-dioxygenase-like lactoylglutathione lyase family enzyme